MPPASPAQADQRSTTAPEARTELLANISRVETQLRIVLDDYRGHPMVSLRMYAASIDGWVQGWGRGVTIRPHELPEAIVALTRAASMIENDAKRQDGAR